MNPLPAPRKVPVVPRPRHGELSASYLARIARANRTEFRSFASLLGRLPGGLPSNPGQLTFTILTLNDAAFARLLAYTGRDAGRLIQAIPSLAPATSADPGEPPALRVASLREQALDCPQCLLRREGAFLDTRLFPLKMACVPHGYWLYRDGAGTRLPATIVPEISRAQRRLARVAARYGTDAAVRAYDIARRYLWEDWRTGGGRPVWYDALGERWYDRADTAASSQSAALPWWAVHPECAALAVMFASPSWAELAVPAADRRHRFFYQHMLAVLGIDNDWRTRRTASIRRFGTLPEDIREQAGWGRLLSDPEWGSPIPSHGAPSKIPFIDITDDQERTAA